MIGHPPPSQRAELPKYPWWSGNSYMMCVCVMMQMQCGGSNKQNIHPATYLTLHY